MKRIMKIVLGALVLLAGVQLLAAQGVGSMGQAGSMVGSSRSQSDLIQRTYTVTGTVKTLRGDPVRAAKVAVRASNYMGAIRELRTDDRGQFSTELKVSLEMVEGFEVDVRVNKRGYLPAHEIVDFGTSGKTWAIPVTLRDSSADPDLLAQKELISQLAPRLKQLSGADGLSEKSAKDFARGVQEFLDRSDADQALPFFSKVAHHDDACIACRTMWGLAQLDSGDWDGAEQNFAQAVNTIHADPTKGRPEPLIAYGVMQSWRRQPKIAAGYLMEAVRFAPQDPLALQELGRSQLSQQNWEAASLDLHKAIAAGAGPDAQLLRVEALLGAGDSAEANQEMNRYLAARGSGKLPPRASRLRAEVQARLKIQETAIAKTDVDRPVAELLGDMPELKGLEPSSDQAQLDSILSEVGKNVAAAFQNYPNTVSLEQIHQEKVQRSGKVGETQDQKFRYLCLSSPESWGPGFSEYRADVSGGPSAQKGLQEGFMLTSGFTSAALMFHPHYRPDARFRYLGRQKVNDRDTFVISFAQQPAKARLAGAFKLNGTPSMTFTQGLAWIDAESYQIVRVRSDLLTPLPQVRLERQTTEIDFGAVHFKKISQEFWLPQRVSVAVDWNGKHLRNEHQYSDFKLFNVNATEKEEQRKEAPPPAKDKTGPSAPL